MKILHLLYESRGDYFGIGGVGIRAYEIYKYLKDRHDITLLCKRYPGAKDAQINGLKHIFIGTESKSLTKTLLSYAWRSARFVRKHGEDFDIIIEEFSPAIPTFLNRYKKKPVVLQIQGYTGKEYFHKYNFAFAATLYFSEKYRINQYKNVIVVSQKLIKKFGFSSKCNIGIISNGIAPELLKLIPAESDYILYLGRIDIYGKGLDTLLKAFIEFNQVFPDIRLLIAGDGRDMEKFKGMLKNLPFSIRNKIELLGWVSGDEKGEVISRAMFCVFPSRHEVQPIAVFEAMACGKPAVVSDISEFAHVVQNKIGLSFMTGDAISLAQSMRDMMMNNERIDMGKKGRDFVKDFTWDKIALKYEEFLQTLETEKV